MNFLSGLFSNDKVKDYALGILKKTMNDNNLQYVVIERKPDGELDLKMLPADQQPVIMSAESMTKIQQIMKEQETAITAAGEAVEQSKAYSDALELRIAELESEIASDNAIIHQGNLDLVSLKVECERLRQERHQSEANGASNSDQL